MAYQGYTGYAGAEQLGAAAQRKRQIADALMQGAADMGPKTAMQGVAQIGQALLGMRAGKQADAAEREYADSRSSLRDALLNAYSGQGGAEPPTPETPEGGWDVTPAPEPKTLGPGGGVLAPVRPKNGMGVVDMQEVDWSAFQMPQAAPVATQPMGTSPDMLRALADYTGDPMAAIQFAEAQKRTAMEAELARQKMERPEFFNTADGIVSIGPDNKPVLAYDVEGPPQDLPEGMMYGENGQIMEIPGYAAMRARIAAAGRAPGSGPETYRNLSPEEVSARGYPKGTVVQVDSRGREMVNSRPSTAQTGQPTESERGAGLHAAISLNGIQTITKMEQGGYNRAGVVEQMGGGLAGENERLYDQAADEFIDGYLRAMTGAAATENEIATYKRQWFPQWGDSKKVLEQKAKGRLNALKGMKSKAGRAWNPEWDGVIATIEKQLGAAEQPAASGGSGRLIQPGEIEDGHRYIGGDRADPASWEPVE